MSKVYIVIEASWEYNDEYYYQTSRSQSGHPKRAFSDRSKAVEMARALDIQQLKGCNIFDYACDGAYSIIEDGCYEKLSVLMYGHPDTDWDNRYECSIPANISDETANQILDCLTIGWYEVVTVNLDE